MAAKNGSCLEILKQEVRQKFAEILAAVQMREKLLLRQLDVIATSQLQHNAGGSRCHVTSTTQQNTNIVAPTNDIKFLAEQENELMASIRCFGRFQLDNMNLALQDVYLKNEDYIEPTDDHETMYKCLPDVNVCGEDSTDAEHPNATKIAAGAEDEEPEAIVVDFSRNKSLVEHSRKLMNKSIINITLQEAKELIRKARLKRESSIPPLNLEELDDEMESSIADALSSLECRSDAAPVASSVKHLQKNKITQAATKTTKHAAAAPQQAEATTTSRNSSSTQSHTANIPKKSKTKRCKPKITINNCNGTINLRNISSLTINCASEEAISAEIPLQVQTDDEEDEVLPNKNATAAAKTKKSNKKSAASTVNSVKKALECIVYSSSTTNNTETSTTPTTSTPSSSSNYSSNASSRSQSKKQSKTPKKAQNEQPPSKSNTNLYDDFEEDDAHVNATCDFYNRLLNEIKNNLHEKPMRYYKVPTTTATTTDEAAANSTSIAAEPDSTSFNADNSSYLCSSSNDKRSSTIATQNTSASTNTQVVSSTQQGPQPGKRLILKNFENLKIILEANSGDEDTFHPVQIEQWLAEIISESDLEPMPNTDILEHSNLHSMNENVVQDGVENDVESESKAVIA